MLDTVFTSVIDSTTTNTAASLSSGTFLMCAAASLMLGVAIALIYMFKHEYNKNFVVTLALLPVVVQLVITLVNGNIGAGIAVMGVFNLVRFRSIPGSAKDIAAVFLAMAVGLATGMGYISLAVLFTVIIAIANVVFVLSPLGNQPSTQAKRSLQVTIPEDLNYCTEFDDVFSEYCKKHELVYAKTTNMGSLYKLEYAITLKDVALEKEFLDSLRVLNGNLTVQCGTPLLAKETL